MCRLFGMVICPKRSHKNSLSFRHMEISRMLVIVFSLSSFKICFDSVKLFPCFNGTLISSLAYEA